jgi:hypothetical protein
MFTLTINPDEGEAFEVETTSRDIAAWERGAKHRSIGRLSEDMRMADIIDLAWYAADRRGLTDLDIVSWRQGVDLDFELKKDKDKADAEDEAAPAGIDARDLDEGAEGPTQPGR